MKAHLFYDPEGLTAKGSIKIAPAQLQFDEVASNTAIAVSQCGSRMENTIQFNPPQLKIDSRIHCQAMPMPHRTHKTKVQMKL